MRTPLLLALVLLPACVDTSEPPPVTGDDAAITKVTDDGTSGLVVARRLCFRVVTEYADAGHGEDYWTQPTGCACSGTSTPGAARTSRA